MHSKRHKFSEINLHVTLSLQKVRSKLSVMSLFSLTAVPLTQIHFFLAETEGAVGGIYFNNFIMSLFEHHHREKKHRGLTGGAQGKTHFFFLLKGSVTLD